MSGTLESFHPTDLALYHRNPRVGNVAVIEDSLRAHSQYRPIVVNRGTHTGRPLEVLAGNHTLKAFRNLAQAYPSDPRWQSVDAYVLDVDDDRAARIVLADNRTAELGGFDPAALADLLDGLPDLAGTAYTEDDLSDLLAGLEESVPPITDPDDGGLVPNRDLDEKAEAYTDLSSRVVVLQYPLARFLWVQERLATYRTDNGLETNSDAILRLLEQSFGETAPDADHEVPDADPNA